jgi:shikimate dehydrogenase
MHNAALAHLGLEDWRYQKLPIPPEAFAETIRALPDQGFAGVNVTIPHKEAALALADAATDTARAVGAANTLTFSEDGRIEADNTDVQGLLDALAPVRSPAGARALVLGAGGAGRAAVHALVTAGAADVMVWNRTPERAESLCREIGGRPVSAAEPADLVVQCTSVGLDGDPDPPGSRVHRQRRPRGYVPPLRTSCLRPDTPGRPRRFRHRTYRPGREAP